MISYAKQLVKENRVKQISQTLFEVDKHSVSIRVKKGRSIMTCSCFNGTLFCNEGICSHKCAVIIYLSDNLFIKRIDKLLDEYKNYKKLKLFKNTEDCLNFILNDLDDIKRLK